MSATASTVPSTTTRVEHSTADAINLRIEHEIAGTVADVATHGHDAIARRLAELDREWDIERVLEANAATVTLLALTLGFAVNRKWLRMPFLVAGFLLLHAFQGWCPPVPILRRLGVRTAREIEIERTALRILRGDFQSQTADPQEAFRIASAGLASPRD
jgi:hypothetical protein